MVRGPAWRFLDMGRRLERGLAICRITRQLTAAADDQADALGVLLDLCDSQITYRSRYLTGPLLQPGARSGAAGSRQSALAGLPGAAR